MQTLQKLRDSIQLITFDCYGTLIDWNQGISGAFEQLKWTELRPREELLEAYHRQEAAVEQTSYRTYRQVQTAVLKALAGMFQLPLEADSAEALSASLPSWPPFEDTNHALRRLRTRYKLGILSNIDRDLFEKTSRHFDVTFDLVVTAQDAHAYKPAHSHFMQMNEFARQLDGACLHAAQSIYHDARPTAQLGIPFVWINRYNDPAPDGVPMLAEFKKLAELADALGV